MSEGLLLALGAIVVVPLAWEYLDFRRSLGLSRLAALATTLLVAPSLAVGFVLALPLASRPGLQWAATVAFTVVVYSLATRAVGAALGPARAPGAR
jgi:hypothetical protein